jgi:GNAT superfamily N-acetyltransferase
MYNDPPVQFLGFKSIRRTTYDFFTCPGCGQPQEGIGYGVDEKAYCSGCDRKFHHAEWGTSKVRRFAAICVVCGKETPLTGYHCSSGPAWFCECGNMLVHKVANSFVSPAEILRFNFASGLHERSARLTKSVRVSDCRTKREHLITRLLFYLGKQEEGAFIFGDWKERKALLCMSEKDYIGYIFWSNSGGKTPVIRQIFVRKEWQRQGVGTAMMKYWAENYAFPFTERFGVESPNIKSYGILQKLGYVEIDRKANLVKFIRCYRAPGM